MKFFKLLTLVLLFGVTFLVSAGSVRAYVPCETDGSQGCCAFWQNTCLTTEQVCDNPLDPYACETRCTSYETECVANSTSCPNSCGGTGEEDTTTGYCGDGFCSDSVNGCSSCPQDCGACASTCGNGSCDNGETCASCGDCQCSGGGSTVDEYCGNGNCGSGENCSNCSDCGTCSGGGTGGTGGTGGSSSNCGDDVCQQSIGENCSTCTADCGACSTSYCGDDVCQQSIGENCSTCYADCGSCATEFCGNGTCAGTESCTTCSSDCGTCSLSGNWWQARGGHVYAGASSAIAFRSTIPDETTCISPACLSALVTPDLDDSPSSYGYPISGGGGLLTNGYSNEGSIMALGTTQTRFTENYDFFYRNSGLGLSPVDDFAGQDADAVEPTTPKTAYFHSGDLTIQQPWTVSDGESYVIFVDGNLTISDPSNVDRLITVSEGSFIAFIVSGNITITEDVGNETLTALTPNIEGLYVADGTLAIESRGVAAGGDDHFVGAGTFVGWSGVDIPRDYDDGAGRDAENADKPTDTFIYRPDLVRNVPDILTRPHSIWQERN